MIVLLIFFVISLFCFSQNDGYVIVEQDQRIEQLIQRQKEIHAADNTIDGFRIQIFMESGNDAVEHANKVTNEFKEKYPDIPHFMLGHSMGSFLVRQYLGSYSEGIAGAVIMGTGDQPTPIVQGGMLICKIISAFKGGSSIDCCSCCFYTDLCAHAQLPEYPSSGGFGRSCYYDRAGLHGPV